MKRQMVVHVGLADFVFATEEEAIKFFKLAANAVDLKLEKVEGLEYVHIAKDFYNPSLKVTNVYTEKDIEYYLAKKEETEEQNSN